ncbi:alginate O-acetyltransferase AlgX-related protein [Methylobacterium oxalidis]|uniref:alginate O-acetyltransferase AlgX-related protein n=1 Tax=Methylobacterium oxalidis TaxID=944322 RepID=UPI0032AF036D
MDGWLFVTAGTNNPLMQFSHSKHMRLALRVWKKLTLWRSRRCKGAGIQYLHVIVPEKIAVYDDKCPRLPIKIRLSPALRLRRSLLWHPRTRRECIRLIGPLRKKRDKQQLYYQTDSHWTFAGRLIAYREICRALGAKPREDFAERPTFEDVLHGDMGSVLEPPRLEPSTFHALQRDAVRTYASPIVLAREAAGQAHTLHVGSHVIFRNETPEADPRRVLLFGDSYSHFATHMLTVMLAETFREVDFIWSTSIDWNYVDRTKPDILITEIAERFMWRVPDDKFNVAIYASERYGQELEDIEISNVAL